MKIDYKTYPKGHTLDDGRFVFVESLGGAPRHARWLGRQTEPPHRRVLISHIKTKYPDGFESRYRYECPGIAPVLFAGLIDGVPRDETTAWSRTEVALVEAMPDGADLTKSGRLGPHETVRLGLGLCETILAWDTRTGIHRGLRPDTVYVTGGPGQRRFSGATPRSFMLLGNDGMYAPFSWGHYNPPAHDDLIDIDVDVD